MAVTNLLDRVTGWTRETICPQITLKVPPDSELGAEDAGWEYREATPAAFAMYVPTKEKLPPDVISPFPSICVRFMEGEDDLTTGTGSVGIQMCFSAWNPGTHGEDVLLENPDDPMQPKRWTGEEADAYFRRSGDGWRDVWNMVDIALREVESVTNIDGFVLDRSKPIKFGPLTEQEAIPDYYPFWFAWISFFLTYRITRNIRGIDNLL